MQSVSLAINPDTFHVEVKDVMVQWKKRGEERSFHLKKLAPYDEQSS